MQPRAKIDKGRNKTWWPDKILLGTDKQSRIIKWGFAKIKERVIERKQRTAFSNKFGKPQK